MAMWCKWHSVRLAVKSLWLKGNNPLFYHIRIFSFGEFVEMLFHSFGPGKFSLFYQNVSNMVNEWKEGRKK